MQAEHDERFMEHALELARKGVGLASPNPTVGCVIVNQGAIVGMGFHRYDWRDHAEIAALKQAGERARGGTAYVTLEPCNHTGRTGPCAEALVNAGVARVVAAMEDPNPKTQGTGFARLRAAGIEVESGVREDEARRLNEGFVKWITSGRPHVTLKAGLTLDGQLALPGTGGTKRREWITGEEARAEVQRMRHAADALVTGIGTVLADNPFLTDRSGLERRRRLLRVVLDRRLRLPEKSRLAETADDDVVVFTAAGNPGKAKRLERAGIEVVRVKSRGKGLDVGTILKELGKREILSVLLEAGPRLNGSALAAGLVDRVTLFYAPRLAGTAATPLAALGKAAKTAYRIVRTEMYGGDLRVDLDAERRGK